MIYFIYGLIKLFAISFYLVITLIPYLVYILIVEIARIGRYGLNSRVKTDWSSAEQLVFPWIRIFHSDY